ncbi:MAG: alginate lyase family protein [Alphaproteobacteria bacterium]
MSALATATADRRKPATAPFLKPTWDGLGDVALRDHLARNARNRFEAVPSAEETRPDRIDMLLDNRFDLIGETHVLQDPPRWTENPSSDRQWLIALHKFYYAVGLGMRYRDTGDARYRDAWVRLIDSWIDQADPLFVNSQVAGRRIQNWIYALHYFVLMDPPAPLPPGFLRRMLASLHQQVDALCRRLDPARNHRTLELAAIFLASVAFPEFEGAEDWRDFALAELAANMRSDMLADGVQCELSTYYHHTVLKNYLHIRRLARRNRIETPPEMDQIIRGALTFSLHAHKPDGEVPAFSDGDVGAFRQLLRLGHALYGDEALLHAASEGAEGTPPPQRSIAFRDSGYVFMRSGWSGDEHYRDARYLALDCGPLGEGDHGHFDLLSFELAAYGRSLIVDPGRFTYQETGDINWRAVFRGTACHNTVLIDGLNQTRYAPGPNVKRTVQGPPPDHALIAFETEPGHDYVHGSARSHEYDAVHERRVSFVGGQYWVLWDVLRGRTRHTYQQRFHLSDEADDKVDVSAHDGSVVAAAPGILIARAEAPGVAVAVEPGFVSRLYGERRPAPVLQFTETAESAVFHTVLFPYRDAAPTLRVRPLAVMRDDGSPAPFEAQAISVEVTTAGGRRFTDVSLIAPVADTGWRFGPGSSEPCAIGWWRFEGSWLTLRLDEHGEPSAIHADADTRLTRLAPGGGA